jgi:hypothetical protein
MRIRQSQDSHIYIALVLAIIAAFATTSRSLSPSPTIDFNLTVAPAANSPPIQFGEAIPWEPSAQEADLTAPP